MYIIIINIITIIIITLALNSVHTRLLLFLAVVPSHPAEPNRFSSPQGFGAGEKTDSHSAQEIAVSAGRHEQAQHGKQNYPVVKRVPRIHW